MKWLFRILAMVTFIILTIFSCVYLGWMYIFYTEYPKTPEIIKIGPPFISKGIKKFQFYEIAPRALYWWLWNNWSIGEVTSFYMNSWTSMPDFEIMEKWITDIFVNKTAYVQRISVDEIKICTQETWWKCFIEKGTLVENFIKKYWL